MASNNLGRFAMETLLKSVRQKEQQEGCMADIYAPCCVFHVGLEATMRCAI
jgi:hypothetical protein